MIAFFRRPLVRYLAGRVAWMVGLLLVISFAAFMLLALAPSSLEATLLGNKNPSPIAIAAVRHKYHLDDPLLERYWLWLTAALHGELGNSVLTLRSVTAEVGDRTMISLQLAAMGLVFVALGGLPLGILAALHHGRSVDRVSVGFSVIGISSPPFATAIVLLYLFAILLPVFPVYGVGGSGGDRIFHLILPGIALALTSMGLMVKATRAAFARELAQDYVVAARARGVSFRYVLWHYVFRNALIPILTVTGLIFGFLIGGSVLVEVAFSIPGLGSLLVSSVTHQDLPIVLGVAMVIAFAVLLLNLVVDLLYAVVDPRVRIGARTV